LLKSPINGKIVNAKEGGRMTVISLNPEAYLYMRTAVRGADGYNSIENQVRLGAAAAWRLGVTITHQLVDEGVSGLTANRAGLSALLAALHERPVSFVILANPDRLARDRLLAAELRQQIERTGATLIFASDLAKNGEKAIRTGGMRWR
jgi:DNA invertase Pin-like site-specific DNA recombinase